MLLGLDLPVTRCPTRHQKRDTPQGVDRSSASTTCGDRRLRERRVLRTPHPELGMSTSDYWTVSRSAAVRNGYSCRGCRGYIAKGAQVREWGLVCSPPPLPPDWEGERDKGKGVGGGEERLISIGAGRVDIL